MNTNHIEDSQCCHFTKMYMDKKRYFVHMWIERILDNRREIMTSISWGKLFTFFKHRLMNDIVS